MSLPLPNNAVSALDQHLLPRIPGCTVAEMRPALQCVLTGLLDRECIDKYDIDGPKGHDSSAASSQVRAQRTRRPGVKRKARAATGVQNAHSRRGVTQEGTGGKGCASLRFGVQTARATCGGRGRHAEGGGGGDAQAARDAPAHGSACRACAQCAEGGSGADGVRCAEGAWCVHTVGVTCTARVAGRRRGRRAARVRCAERGGMQRTARAWRAERGGGVQSSVVTYTRAERVRGVQRLRGDVYGVQKTQAMCRGRARRPARPLTMPSCASFDNAPRATTVAYSKKDR
ncbi:hypothetical protein GGX14DRAFT_401876 [Mycena pura]|uniref:Uncharacterized protein n=1 Tax=Mycena pura TaxID=153505 RepID=A0AAD6V327_9AGAR|nr:hypothetical protein GGX14DRAFT_401876 [Mycena pura]